MKLLASAVIATITIVFSTPPQNVTLMQKAETAALATKATLRLAVDGAAGPAMITAAPPCLAQDMEQGEMGRITITTKAVPSNIPGPVVPVS